MVVVVVVQVGAAFTLSSVAYGSTDHKVKSDQQAAAALQRAHTIADCMSKGHSQHC